ANQVRRGGRSGYLAGARPRSRQYPRQTAHVPDGCRCRGHRPRSSRPDHPDEPRRQREGAPGQLRRGDVAGARSPNGRWIGRGRRRLIVQGVLVINAGSSSIKASLFRVTPHAEPTLAIRGQIEGIATAKPRLVLKRSDGTVLADSAVDAGKAADHRGAMAIFAEALSGSAERAAVDAVGHRGVHGGVTYSGPGVVDPRVLRPPPAPPPP